MKPLVGLSVSFCIKDICKGQISRGDVELICAGFDLSATSLDRVFERYSQVYWVGFEEEARELLFSLPLSSSHPYSRNISSGHWMKSSDFSDFQLGVDCRMGLDEAVKFVRGLN